MIQGDPLPTTPRPSMLARAWDALVEPTTRIDDVGDRMRARFLAGILAVLLAVGVLSSVLQLALVPGFGHTFRILAGALALFAVAYAASRTRAWRASGAVAALVLIAVCVAVVAVNPDDRGWHAFMTLSVVLASAVLPWGGTLAVAALALVAAVGMVAASPELRAPSRFVPVVAFQVLFSTLMLLAARHRDRVEERRRTTLLASQAAIAEAHRLETVGRLAGGVAHDFANLLTVIQANTALLRARPVPVEPEAGEIEHAAERSSELVRRLLAFARSRTVQARRVAPAEVVASMEDILRRLAGPGVSLSIQAPAAGRVLIDPSQVEQVVLNLVVNARDAMPQGGSLRLALRDVEVRAGDAAAADGLRPGAYVAIEVADTGAGIPEDVRPRIFEPFFTTKGQGGTGFGLAIVHGVVKEAGGGIAVRSAVGRGSTFTVFLPQAETEGERAGS